MFQIYPEKVDNLHVLRTQTIVQIVRMRVFEIGLEETCGSGSTFAKK